MAVNDASWQAMHENQAAPPLFCNIQELAPMLLEDMNKAIVGQYRQRGRINGTSADLKVAASFEQEQATRDGPILEIKRLPLRKEGQVSYTERKWPAEDQLAREVCHVAMRHVDAFLNFASAAHQKRNAVAHKDDKLAECLEEELAARTHMALSIMTK